MDLKEKSKPKNELDITIIFIPNDIEKSIPTGYQNNFHPSDGYKYNSHAILKSPKPNIFHTKSEQLLRAIGTPKRDISILVSTRRTSDHHFGKQNNFSSVQDTNAQSTITVRYSDLIPSNEIHLKCLDEEYKTKERVDKNDLANYSVCSQSKAQFEHGQREGLSEENCPS